MAHPESWAALGGSLLFFLSIWSLATWRLTQAGWKPGRVKANTVSSCMSFIHGTSTTVLSAAELLKYGPYTMDGLNTPWQEIIMQYSMAYFFIDMFHCWYYDLDYLFIGHHLLTNSYMMSSNLLGRGALSVMMLMYSGECTSTVQNVWSISADHKDVSARALRVYRVVQAPFTVFFSVSRVLVGPCFLYFVVKGLVFSLHLNLLTRAVWCMIAVAGCCGSWVWVRKLVRELMEATAEKKAAKGKGGSKVA